MDYAPGDSLVFLFAFTASDDGAGVADLTPTVSVCKVTAAVPAGTVVATGTATETAMDGLYSYVLPNAEAGYYVAKATTTSEDVTAVELFSLCTVSDRVALLDHLDADISDVATPADVPTAAQNADAVWDEATAGHVAAGSAGAALTAPPTAAAITDAVWDEATAGHVAAGSTGKALTDGSAPAATIADAVWDESIAAHTTAGSAARELHTAASYGTGQITVQGPINPITLAVQIIRGDTYDADESRAIEWTITGWSDFSGGTAKVRIQVAADTYVEYTAAITVGPSPATVQLELTSAQTALLNPDDYTYEVEITHANTHVVTPVRGKWTVDADVR